jgi:ATPase subunit of ABC transporter with duplicated ATPase domains
MSTPQRGRTQSALGRCRTTFHGVVEVKSIFRTCIFIVIRTAVKTPCCSILIIACAPSYTTSPKGRGGRGRSRNTLQTDLVAVPDVRLEYVHSHARVLLDGATLKLMLQRQHVYALIGTNGSGKSTLLRRMGAGKIPGFPPHISSLYVSQLLASSVGAAEDGATDDRKMTALEWLVSKYRSYCRETVQGATEASIQEIESKLEALDVNDTTNLCAAEQMEEYAEYISELEDDLAENDPNTLDTAAEKNALEALTFMGIRYLANLTVDDNLTGGERQKLTLSLALFCCMSTSCDLLLLDEPTNALDIPGLLRLRHLIETVVTSSTTVILVSHDIDLINDVATDVIEFDQTTLLYYSGNYNDYLLQRQQKDRHQHRLAATMEKKQESMKQTLQNLQKKPTPRRGGAKKKSKQITSYKKKMDRELGANPDATERAIVRDEPDKSIQFRFRNSSNQWDEPLILAMEVGHGCAVDPAAEAIAKDPLHDHFAITKKEGFLFDCIDLCIKEGGIYCIMGESASGKTTLLKILAKLMDPVEGKVDHALNVTVSYLDDDVCRQYCASSSTPLEFLMGRYPLKTEQELRGELANFGLNPHQASTSMHFLSGGERCRLTLATEMLRNPDVLCLDQPTANLDAESVEALIYGLKHWNGTTVMISHDTHFLRELDATCFVLVRGEGKIRRVEGGVDPYLRSFGKQ